MKDLFAAVCLVAVLEGLFLFVAPFAWKRMAERLLDLPSPALRSFGGLVLLAGLSLLWWVRHYRAGPERPARPGGAADRPVKPPVGKVAPDPGNPDNAQKPDGPPRSAFSVSGPSIAGRSPFGAALQVLASPATVYPSAAPMAATNRGARHGSVCRSVGCPVGR
ncbi:DUF2065 domain-containing protein [Stenotrophomonas maltophilia]|uniref:DUF2065 domain-containing protein n=2 Tax=Stenotrophomonas maltophilia TaxID=40324 RepID=UPI00130F7A09|nr:DUF2065 family protein [Pseudomonas cichorii]